MNKWRSELNILIIKSDRPYHHCANDPISFTEMNSFRRKMGPF